MAPGLWRSLEWSLVTQVRSQEPCEFGEIGEGFDPAVGGASPQVFQGKGKRINGEVPQTASTAIVLTNRGNEKLLTSYAGAVKSQLRISRHAETKDYLLTFLVSVEPRLVAFESLFGMAARLEVKVSARRP